MEFMRGGQTSVAHESVSDVMLLEYGIKKPDFIPTIMRLWPDEAPLISILDIKGQKSKDLSYATNDSNYRTVGSNHVQFPIEFSKQRMDSFAVGPGGKTFVCDLDPDYPGRAGSEIVFWSDGNWAGYQEVIELADNKSQIFIKNIPEFESNETFRYVGVINGRQGSDDYIDPSLFDVGNEFKAQMNQHEHDFSEMGTEKYQFDGWGDAFLTLQRFKHSRSGTAAATTTMSGNWVMHKGQKLFIEQQQGLMMKRAAEYLNYQLVFGKSTVSTMDKSKVTLHNDKGREVLAGDGVMNANGGAIEFPLNEGWSMAFIDALMEDMDPYVQPDNNGVREVALLMTQRSYADFQRLMKKYGVTQNDNIEGSGSDKGINDTYGYYEFAGIRFVPKRWKALDPSNRPGLRLPDGTKSNAWDTIAIPTGNTPGGNKGLELIQLRPSVSGTVAGVDQGGNVSSSVDGTSNHILFQNGIMSQITPFYIRRI